MGVHRHGSTPEGALTPICENCGVSLCWDIGRTEYLEAKAFWDIWKCEDCNGSRLSAYAWKCANGREALPELVIALIDAFADAHPEYQDRPTAHGRSKEASDKFADTLRVAGVTASLTEIESVNGSAHIGVALGDFTIDWTATQYDEHAPFPLVYRSSLGWPIEPDTTRDLINLLSKMSDEEFEQLKARMAARRKAA